MQTREGWHFLRADRCLSHAPHTPVIVGETLHLPPDETPQVCVVGFHACTRAIDALRYAPCSTELWICRVVVGGPFSDDNDGGKFCGAWRRALWMAPARNTIIRWALWCAKGALLGRALSSRPVDARSWDGIATAERYLDGQAMEPAAVVREAYAAAIAAYYAAPAVAAYHAASATITPDALAYYATATAHAAAADTMDRYPSVAAHVGAAIAGAPVANAQAHALMAAELERRLWALASQPVAEVA